MASRRRTYKPKEGRTNIKALAYDLHRNVVGAHTDNIRELNGTYLLAFGMHDLRWTALQANRCILLYFDLQPNDNLIIAGSPINNNAPVTRFRITSLSQQDIDFAMELFSVNTGIDRTLTRVVERAQTKLKFLDFNTNQFPNQIDLTSVRNGNDCYFIAFPLTWTIPPSAQNRVLGMSRITQILLNGQPIEWI